MQVSNFVLLFSGPSLLDLNMTPPPNCQCHNCQLRVWGFHSGTVNVTNFLISLSPTTYLISSSPCSFSTMFNVHHVFIVQHVFNVHNVHFLFMAPHLRWPSIRASNAVLDLPQFPYDSYSGSYSFLPKPHCYLVCLCLR